MKRLAQTAIMALLSIATINVYAGADQNPPANMAKSGKYAYDHDPNHPGHADCIRVDAMNYQGMDQRLISKTKSRTKHSPINTRGTAIQRIAATHSHNPNHPGHAMCIQVDRLNQQGAVVKRVNSRRSFAKQPGRTVRANLSGPEMRAARQLLAMNLGKQPAIKRISKHDPNHPGHAMCVQVDRMNQQGAVVKRKRK